MTADKSEIRIYAAFSIERIYAVRDGKQAGLTARMKTG